MLSATLQRMASKTVPKLFDKTGTENVQIVRDTTVINDYGGSETSTTTTGQSIPCVLYTKPNVRWILGDEFLDGRIWMPAMYRGSVVDLKMTDKLKILARTGNNPERLYSVKDIQNKSGVYLDVGVVMES